jgi:hypothetical protein
LGGGASNAGKARIGIGRVRGAASALADLMLTLAIPLAHLAFLTGDPADGTVSGEMLIARSGLEKMHLMHAGFKRLAGEDTGMNLDEPFLTALELFNGQPGET